ncbi:nitrogenase cofactor biosynthesis protein NifB [Cupriavidus sp. UYPR2.512]|uniref:nitrogenase cofactor biosynthesis protein NifB n=1 Tax=Cupriavidus sp. UYPR2.512 TaxID=1080187 RepID=UPI0006878AF4|nr:nitrogenase cofactor biosynthesis protein NifB [Cupriavidus sp. UYPR2.512]
MRDSASASMRPAPACIGDEQKIVPLVPNSGTCAPRGGGSSFGGVSMLNCASSGGDEGMAPEVWEKIRDHPCYSEEAHHHYARMHVAVAPACNLQCNYCNRKYDCSNESRPGVTSQKLTPEQAVRKVMAVASRVPQLTVVGIAGPGDSLANPGRTFETFRLLRERAPEIKLCLSTNGLALPDFVDDICQYNIDHVTITINMVDPVVGAKIYPWIFWNRRRLTGKEAACVLHERQMRGLEMLAERGVLTKINSVLIPGINDEHLVEVNRAVKERGAFLHNIMPLISNPSHGTYFGLHQQRGPTAQELKKVQEACSGGANLMRHCRQCRADAVGLLGEDRSEEFSLDKIEQIEIEYDRKNRREYQWRTETEVIVQREAKKEVLALARANKATGALKVHIAVATKGGGRVNAHFGHISELQVFEVSATGAHFVGHRRVESYCQAGYGDDEGLLQIIRAINDCHAVLVAKMGSCPRKELSDAGIEAVDKYAGEIVEVAALSWFNDYSSRVAGGVGMHKTHRGRSDPAERAIKDPTTSV